MKMENLGVEERAPSKPEGDILTVQREQALNSLAEEVARKVTPDEIDELIRKIEEYRKLHPADLN